MGKLGKKIGSVLRNTGRSLAFTWHQISPFVNKLAKEYARELGPIGLEIIRNIVMTFISKELTGEQKRTQARKQILDGLNKAKIAARDRAVNFYIEVFAG